MTTATDQDAASIDRLVAQLGEAHDDDVDALVTQYRAGKLALDALTTQAHDLIAQHADDALDDITPGKRGGSHVLLYGGLLASVGGLAMLANKPDTVPDVGETSSMFALNAAAAEYGGDIDPAVVEEVRRSLEERLQDVSNSLSAGDISDGQAAAYVETILMNDAWLTYGTEQNQQAQDAGETQAWWEREASKNGCSDCQDREDESPYAIDDLPGIPGDQSTSCNVGCLCSVRYGSADEEKAVKRDVVAEAHCITCDRWVGRNINADATVYCPKCKATSVIARKVH